MGSSAAHFPLLLLLRLKVSFRSEARNLKVQQGLGLRQVFDNGSTKSLSA